MLIITKTYTKGIIMSYKHLSINERIKIEVLNKEGYSARKIAIIIGFHHSTVSREIKRCSTFYSAERAHIHSKSFSKNKGRKTKMTSFLKFLIEDRINKSWSPEQIVGRYFQGVISFKTIYNWIYLNLLNIDLNALRFKGKSRYPKENRGKFNVGKSISNRPIQVKERSEFGHWELDTVVSSRGKSKGCLATFAEMKTRMYLAVKMNDRSKNSMNEAIKKLIASFPKNTFKSFTSDRGKEFACYKEVEEKLKINFYFADPYSAWQRGTNENSNGLLREYYPKKTDLAKIDEIELMNVLYEINSRPRKCLGFKSNFEAFLYEMNFL